MIATQHVDRRTDLKNRALRMTSVVSYPKRCSLWGRADYRGNCDGRLFLGLVLRYKPTRVADPMAGSGTTRDVIDWLNRTEGTAIEYWGSDLKDGFNLHAQDLPGEFDLVWLHPPYWNIIEYSEDPADLSTCDIRRFLLHVLPSGFMRIRHFGFLANRSRRTKLERCRQHLGVADSPDEQAGDAQGNEVPSPAARDENTNEPRHDAVCPTCKSGRMVTVAVLPRPLRNDQFRAAGSTLSTTEAERWDTS